MNLTEFTMNFFETLQENQRNIIIAIQEQNETNENE